MTIKPLNRIKGFTLIELITVIIIVAIIGIVGASKFFSHTAFKEAQVQQEVLAALRYAQKIAIASQCPVHVSLSSNAYNLSYALPCSGNVKHPGSQNNYSTSNTPATINSSSNTFSFDASGNISPASGGTISIGAFKINIEAVSGFAHE